MKKTTIFTCYVFLAALSMSVMAARGNLRGVGTDDCGAWLEARAGRSNYSGIDWVQGFISSYNFYNNEDTFGSVSWQSLAAYIDKYCRDNPLSHVHLAADAFIKREK